MPKLSSTLLSSLAATNWLVVKQFFSGEKMELILTRQLKSFILMLP